MSNFKNTIIHEVVGRSGGVNITPQEAAQSKENLDFEKSYDYFEQELGDLLNDVTDMLSRQGATPHNHREVKKELTAIFNDLLSHAV